MSVAVAGALLFLTALAGGFLTLRWRINLPVVGFVSGVILSTIFLRMFPGIFASHHTFTHIFALAGTLLALLLDKTVLVEHHISENSLACWQCPEPLSPKILAGLFMHYVADGIFLGNSMVISSDIFFIALPILLHKFVDGIVLASIYSGKENALRYIALLSTGSPIGIFIGALFHSAVAGEIFLSVSAGMLTYVAIHDFLPAINSKKDTVAFAGGIAFIFALKYFVHPH